MATQESFYSQTLSANVTDLIAGTWTISVKPTTATAGWFVVSKDDPAKREVVYVSAFPTATTATVTLRGQDGTTAKTHEAGEPFELTDTAAWYNDHEAAILARVLKAGDTMSGPLGFSGAANRGVSVAALTTAQINALVAPPDGTEVYDTTTGEFKDRIGGAWVVRAAGGVFPNADTATAGKSEKNTQAESDAGTDLGGTGASLFMNPATGALSVQKGVWTYVAGGGAANAYTATYAPAITALVVGMELTFLAGFANTGACTFNPNGLGAQSIKKEFNTALAENDILNGQMVRIKWDGTNWQLMSPVGNAPVTKGVLTTKGDIFAATGAGAVARLGVGADGTCVFADSTQPSGLGYAVPILRYIEALSRSAAAGGGNQTITHNLNRLPKLVKITLRCAANAQQLCFSDGLYDGTNNICVAGSSGDANVSAAYQDNTNIIYIDEVGFGALARASITAMTTTTITLNWGTNVNRGGTRWFNVEVLA